MTLDLTFADNPEPRCPCVLLLDVSGSMTGSPIEALNEGLRAFKQEVAGDSLASRRVEVAIVTFGDSVRVIQDFVTLDEFQPPSLVAGGPTPMAAAIDQALQMVTERKRTYNANGITYYRPWLFMVTDGAPTDPAPTIQAAASRLMDEQQRKRVVFFAVAVEEANIDQLKAFTLPDRPPVRLKGLQFVELFIWLSQSQQAVAHSRPGEQVPLPPAGWQAV